jgi:hypothetical protein
MVAAQTHKGSGWNCSYVCLYRVIKYTAEEAIQAYEEDTAAYNAAKALADLARGIAAPNAR